MVVDSDGKPTPKPASHVKPRAPNQLRARVNRSANLILSEKQGRLGQVARDAGVEARLLSRAFLRVIKEQDYASACNLSSAACRARESWARLVGIPLPGKAVERGSKPVLDMAQIASIVHDVDHADVQQPGPPPATGPTDPTDTVVPPSTP